MSKFLQVPNGDYKIQVQEGGNIVLDTGFDTGQVRITGDLVVEGNTTTVDTENVTIEDNILLLNKGQEGAGINRAGERTSGIEIERGDYLNAFIVFDEDRAWLDPITGTTKFGAFEFKQDGGAYLGIRTSSITTGGSDLFLISNGVGVVSVAGTTNYEQQIFTYTDPTTVDVIAGATEDDAIPNTKAIIDYVDSYFAGIFQDRIEEGVLTKTFVETLDVEETGVPSLIRFGVDDTTVAEFYEDRLELNSIRINGTKVETTSSNEDLILSAPGTGAVKVNDVLQISSQPTIDDGSLEPSVPGEGLRLYVADRTVGGTGLFFVHNDQTRDEIISNNRSLVYGMIF